MSNFKTLLKNNKQEIKRKTLVVIGATVGLVLTSAALEGLRRTKTEYILIEEPDVLDETYVDDSMAP